MPRQIVDSALSQTFGLPNQSNTANSNIFDLGSTTPFSVTEAMGVQLSNTSAAGSNNKNLTVQLMHSADNATTNMVNIPGTGPLLVGEVSILFAATNLNIALPPNTKRYVMAQAKVEANGGNANTGNAVIKFVF